MTEDTITVNGVTFDSGLAGHLYAAYHAAENHKELRDTDDLAVEAEEQFSEFLGGIGDSPVALVTLAGMLIARADRLSHGSED